MKFLFKKGNITTILLILAVTIRLYYYFLTLTDHQILFALPITRGQDFFQIPNGAFSFIKGLNLTGREHLYINCCGVNDNVYHPFFTLFIGLPLIIFSPWISFYLWILLHFLSDLIIIYLLIKFFSKSNLLRWLLIFYLINFYNYYEIINNQYHYLLNLFTFLFLLELYFNKKSILSTFYYLSGLLIKPIGLIWTISLIINKRYKIAIFSLFLFLLTCLPFYFNNIGKYYFDNLSYNIVNSNYANWNIFYIFSYFNINNIPIQEIKFTAAILIILFCIIFRANIIESIILWIIYVLFIYQNNFPYHFSIISIIIPSVYLLNNGKINVVSVLSILILTFPFPFMQTLSEKLIFLNSDVNTNKKLLFLVWAYIGLILFSGSFIISIIKKKINYVRL